ncbi:MAG: 3-deoxy-manno-octulosonate cytidylyltransferase [Pseudomonadota bacterium]|nr:3-deoxy-manno-octulosonate cytidylyltransferase [Pseudomonadota bacterium]
MYHIVIPARYGSTRLPAKALADINGKPLVYWVWRQAMQSKAVSVTVATDDVRIQEAMMPHGADVAMTDPDHPSGTDRLAEVARLKDWDSSAIVVNLQGDEPLMPVANLEQVADLLNGHPEASMATLCEPIDTADAFQDASVVKVVADASGRAHYFSRSPIPHVRGADEAFVPSEARRHVGLYAYRVSFLADFTSQPVAPLEQLELLEQLRALHCGHEIRIADAIEPVPAGVDTQKDLDAVRRLMAP